MRDDLAPLVQSDDSWGKPALKLLCPICGSSWQHHGDVAVYEREGGEDTPSVVLATFDQNARVLRGGNPSGRRNGIRIEFQGECEHEWFLEIVQHKGETFVFCNQQVPLL